jgi:hypothetical protein
MILTQGNVSAGLAAARARSLRALNTKASTAFTEGWNANKLRNKVFKALSTIRTGNVFGPYCDSLGKAPESSANFVG